MDAMKFTVLQLIAASSYRPIEEPKKVDARLVLREECKNKLHAFIAKTGGATNDQCAKHLKKSAFTIRHYLQDLVNEDRAFLIMQAHNKPAIYKAK